MLLHVIYTKDGQTVADEKAIEFATELIQSLNRFTRKGMDLKDIESEVKVANAIVIHAFRLLVRRGTIHHREIVFYNEDKKTPLRIDSNGKIDNWPDGFCEVYERMFIEFI